MSQFLRSLAAGAIWAAAGIAAMIPFFVGGSDKAPQFYGAFTAAIVAAIAVVLGAHYQAELTRRRDDEVARRVEIAEATDLFFWLEHAIGEMTFIADLLQSFHDQLGEDDVLKMPMEQYREVASSRFMEELRERAKSAARLSPVLAVAVAPTLYKTFLAVDRVHRFRGVPDDAKVGRRTIEGQLLVSRRRIAKLEEAQAETGKFLEKSGMDLAGLDA